MRDKKDVILYILIGAILVGIVSYFVLNGFSPSEKTVVPDFMAMTVEEIEAWAQENEIELEFLEVFDELIPEKGVVSQDPSAKTQVKKGQKITIVISKGPEILMVQLPDFSKMKVEDIQKFVEDSGLSEVSYEFETSDTIEKDYLIRISTDKKEVPQNEVIVITISMGKDANADIVIPDFSNYTKAQIDNWKIANSVKVTYTYENSDKVDRNKVISQSPAAGKTVKPNATITVKLSYGPAISAKDFTGDTKATVDAWAKEYDGRFKLSYESKYSNTVAEGKIISMTPSSGKIPDNSTVKVIISLGKPVITNFTGKTYSSFESNIASLNKNGAEIKITRNADAFSDTVPSGSIISQSKTSGTIDVGSTITITVSKGKQPVYVTIENHQGKPETTLLTWLQTKKLVAGTKTEMYSDTIASGSIISQSPASGSVLEGTSISYVLSLGKYTPEAFSGTFAEAQIVINTANNKGAGGWTIVKGADQYDNSVPAGKLIPSKQSINGKQITVVASKGPSTTVGNYVGRDYLSVGSNDNYLSVKFIGEASDSIPAGQIIRQSIPAGTEVERGREITLTYSTGKKPSAIVKAYTSIHDAAADPNDLKVKIENELKGQGFLSVTVTIETDPGGATRGVVFYQSEVGITPLDTPIIVKIAQ